MLRVPALHDRRRGVEPAAGMAQRCPERVSEPAHVAERMIVRRAALFKGGRVEWPPR
jgi:hypothetical protein